MYRMSSGTYYYTCGTNVYTDYVLCLKNDKEFKEFDTPHHYKQITRLALSKSTADKKFISGGAVGVGPVGGGMTVGISAIANLMGLVTSYSASETGEERILNSELKTRSYGVVYKE